MKYNHLDELVKNNSKRVKIQYQAKNLNQAKFQEQIRREKQEKPRKSTIKSKEFAVQAQKDDQNLQMPEQREMFKKKSPTNFQPVQRQFQKDQKIYGIQAKLEEMIQNGNRSGMIREKQNKARVTGNAEIYQQASYKKRQEIATQEGQKNQNSESKSQIVGRQRSGLVVRKTEQKKGGSFESQLKGLVKIIYQKEKQIQKLKQTIKSTSIRGSSTTQSNNPHSSLQLPCPKCNDQSMDLGINVQDIKQTTKRILELEGKQEELHEVIDFLVRKEEEAGKKIKVITGVNERLEVMNRQLMGRNDKVEQELRCLQDGICKYEAVQTQIKKELDIKNQQILRLNSDILKVIQQSQHRETQLNLQINTPQSTLCQTQTQLQSSITQHTHTQNQEQLSKAIDDVRNQFEKQIDALEYEIGNLRAIEEESKSIVREQEIAIEQLEQKLLGERQHMQRMARNFDAQIQLFKQETKTQQYQIQQKVSEIHSLTLEVDNLKQQLTQTSHQNNILTLQISHLKQQIQQFSDEPIPSQQSISVQLLQLQIKIDLHQSTITKYKKLLEQLQKQINSQQQSHQQQLNALESQIQQYLRQMANLETKNSQLIEASIIFVEKISKSEAQLNKLIYQLETLKTQCKTMQICHEQSLANINSKHQTQSTKLKQSNSQLQAQLQFLQNVNNQLSTKLHEQQIIQSNLAENLSSAKQSLIELTQTITELQTKIAHYQQQLVTLEANHNPPITSNILSLPTINNLSCIDLADSSFQCNLQRIHTKRVTFDQPQNQPEIHQTQQNSLEENSSYIKYQDNLLQQLERQCNQPTQIFMNHQNDRTKLVELSQVRQSLKMTKEVNFQLFEEINRQEKLIQDFKNSLRNFIQTHKIKSVIPFDKLQQLLLLK